MRKAFAVIAVTMSLLIVTACSSSSKDSSKPATPSKATIDVALADFMITPHTLTAPVGAVTFHVHNDGKSPHNFKVRKADQSLLGGTKDLNPGKSEDVQITLPAGTFDFYCSVSGHESLGMKGALTVA